MRLILGKSDRFVSDLCDNRSSDNNTTRNELYRDQREICLCQPHLSLVSILTRSSRYKKDALGRRQLRFPYHTHWPEKIVNLTKMKVLIVLVAVVACATAFQTCGKKGAASRIVNGLPAGHGEFPWQISLRFSPFAFFQKQHICGGEFIYWYDPLRQNEDLGYFIVNLS